MSNSVLPVFLSRSFMVSSLIFRSLIHFEFIFVYGVSECSNFILLHVAVQFSGTTYWRDCLFSIGYSCLLCHRLIDCKCVGHGVVLYIVVFFFIYSWLCWVFVSVRGLFLVAASGGHSSSQCAGLFTIAASLVVEHRLQTRRLSNCGSRA